MTVKELAEKCNFKTAALPDGSREIDGCYIGDLLSWVMGRAEADCVWITIMSNLNIIAVASLADVACIVLSESVTVEDSIVKLAEEKGVNVLLSDKKTYETAVDVYKTI